MITYAIGTGKAIILTNIHFYGLNIRKPSLQNASKDPANKRTECALETTGEDSAGVTFPTDDADTNETSINDNEATIQDNEEEEAKFCATLNLTVRKAVVLRLVPPYAKDLALKDTLPSYPKPITDLYHPAVLLLTYPNLLKECKHVYALYKVLLIL